MALSAEDRKIRTIELYDSLPRDKEERMKCLSVRDEIIDLNYKFFGYVASNTFVDNTTYEDKLQTALLSFLGMWWKFRYEDYRDDLSFAVFFKPRISEEIRRFLAPVSYTVRRTLCMKAAAQLDKSWTQITYDDLSNVNLPPKDMMALKAVLGAAHPADLAEFEMYLEAPMYNRGIEKYCTSKFDSLEELLIQEMVETETRVDDKKLRELSEMYSIDYIALKTALPKALDILYKRLTENL